MRVHLIAGAVAAVAFAGFAAGQATASGVTVSGNIAPKGCPAYYVVPGMGAYPCTQAGQGGAVCYDPATHVCAPRRKGDRSAAECAYPQCIGAHPSPVGAGRLVCPAAPPTRYCAKGGPRSIKPRP